MAGRTRLRKVGKRVGKVGFPVLLIIAGVYLLDIRPKIVEITSGY